MKDENSRSLDNLGRTCYRSGVFILFLGVLITFIHIVNQNYNQALVGILVFITGYGYAKIAAKLRNVINSEK